MVRVKKPEVEEMVQTEVSEFEVAAPVVEVVFDGRYLRFLQPCPFCRREHLVEEGMFLRPAPCVEAAGGMIRLEPVAVEEEGDLTQRRKGAKEEGDPGAEE